MEFHNGDAGPQARENTERKKFSNNFIHVHQSPIQ
jgi:hypothetical protein